MTWVKRLQTQILNLPDALQLASIVNKYVDTKSIPDTPLEFIDNILDKVVPMDYIKLVKILTKEGTQKVAKLSGNELLEILFSGLEKNKILSLLDAYKSIGFT